MESIIYFIEKMAQRWLPFIVTSSLQLGIFLIIIAVLTFLFRKQSAKFLYVLWLIGLLKVLLPPTITLPDFFGTANLPIDPNILILPIPEINFVTTAMRTPELSFKGYLLLFWMVCILLISAIWIYNNIRFHWKIKNTSFLMDSSELFDNEKSLDSNIKFYSGPNITIPFTQGIFKPKIFLPDNALTWSKNELRAVILHEYAHIKRKDILIIAVQNLIQILFFFHPLVWLANIQIARYREKACDDFAINAMKGNSIDYSKFLLKSINNAIHWQPIPSMSNYFNQSKRSLLNRFEYILNHKEDVMKKFSRLQKFVVVFLIIIGVAISCHKDNLTNQSTVSTGESSKDFDLSKSDVIEKQNLQYDVAPIPLDEPTVLIELSEFAEKAGVMITLTIDEKGNLKSKRYKMTRFFDEKYFKKNEDNLKSISKKLMKVIWQPAQKDGKAVSAEITLPFSHKGNQIIAEKIEKVKATHIPYPPPPPPSDSSEIIFVPYNEAPQPIGGFKAIQENLVYPELAQKAGIEGTVIVYAKVSENGKVVNTKIVKPLGTSGCNEAAVQALKSVKWKPAYQKKDKPVAVWVSVPVKFKLSSHKKEGNILLEKDIQQDSPKELVFPKNEIERLPYDTPPEPVEGIEAIYKNFKLPNIAKELSLEGKVEIYTKIDENGNIIDIRTKKSLCTGCNEAAIKAIKSVKWNPAKLNNKPVAVWVVVPLYLTIDGDWKRLKQGDFQERIRKIIAEPIKQIPPPPHPIQNFDDLPFVPYDDFPKPIGGFKAIQKNLVYPEAARKAGIEGSVAVYTQVNADGTIGDTKISKFLGHGCDEAAVKAIKSIKWEPAKQKGKPVTVWVSVPVKFKLNGTERKAISGDQKENEIIKFDEPTPHYYPPSEQLKNNEDQIPFVPYDDPPQPIGGFDAIQKKVYYPEIAQKAGIEGTVIIYAKVSVDGKIINTKVVKPLGNSGCNEAAIQAIKSVEWKPVMQKDKPVSVWVSVPVKFSLNK